MSTFEGRMKEYRLVSLDRFDGGNLSSTVYFLSHTHSDHTVGLDQAAFFARLKQRGNSYLYCSAITRILLLGNEKKYGHLAPYIKPLETLCPTTIDIPAACDKDQNSTVLVTLLPAAHCLGSVMFLFEGDEGNVLYTGDFRWGMSEATQMPYLDPSAKPLRSIYVDTTFCYPKTFCIPSREQCEAGVINLANSYFQEYGSNGHIWIESRTSFGHEILLKELSLHMKMKIHVVHWKKVLYDQIPGLEDIFTENAEETRIHAHPIDKYKRLEKNALPCGYVSPNKNMNLIQIKPSTMWFTTLPEIKYIVQQTGAGRYRACYSFHSSYAEIRDLVQYLKPARVFPSVIPTSKTFDEIQDSLNSFLSTPHYKHFSSVESEERPLGIMKISKASLKDSVSVEDCAFDDTPNQLGNSQQEIPIQNSQSGNSQEETSIQNSQSGNSQEETSIQNSQSSYDGSHKADSELDLYSDEESRNFSQTSEAKDQPTENSLPLSGSLQPGSSLPAYVEDNSDDSEYEEGISQNEDLKSQIEFNSSKSGNNFQEHKKEQDFLEAGKISNARDSCNGEVDKEEEICAKRSKDKIDLGKIFGSQNSFEDNSDDSEYEEGISQNENLKSQIVFNSSKSGDENKESVEISLKLPENTFSAEKYEDQKMKELSAHTLKPDAGDNYQEHKKEQDLLEAGKIANARDSCNGEVDKEEEICAKRSKDKIDLGKLFGSQNSFFVQLDNSESSHQICEDRNVSAVFISSKNVGDNCSESEPDVLKQTSVGEPDADEHKESHAGDAVNSHKSFIGNSVDSYNFTEEKAVDTNEQSEEMDQEENNFVTEQKENSCSSELKLPGFEERLFSSTPNEKHKANNKCSQEKYCKTDLSLNSVKWQLNGIPLDETDNVKTASKKEVLQMKLEAGHTSGHTSGRTSGHTSGHTSGNTSGNTSKCQKENSSKEKPITPPSDSHFLHSNASRLAVSPTNETLKENNQLIKYDNALSSFNNKNKKIHQSLNPKDMILHEENCQSSFSNNVPPIDSNSDISVMTDTDIKLKKCNDVREMKLSQESTKSDVSIEIIKEISKRRTLVVEISDSEDDDCIAIDSDSDKTLPPSPGFLESSQELFSSSDAITDPSSICDLSDNDGVVIIKTSTPIQNGSEKGKNSLKKKNSIIITLD